jgi:hypothetical protein
MPADRLRRRGSTRGNLPGKRRYVSISGDEQDPTGRRRTVEIETAVLKITVFGSKLTADIC